MTQKDLAAFQRFQKGKGKGGKEGRTCNNCGMTGHLRADCRKPGGGAYICKKDGYTPSGGKGGKGKGAGGKSCFTCGKTGHLSKDCWQGKGKGGGGSKGGGKAKGGKGGKGKGKSKGKSAGSFEVDGNDYNDAWQWDQQEQAAGEPEELCSLEKVVNGNLPSQVKDLSAMDAGEGWIRCNFDTGAAETAIPKTLSNGPLVASNVTYKTASGELVPGYGLGTLEGGDEHGKTRKIGGEFTEVHKILASAAAVHEKGHFSILEAGGGYVIPLASKVGKEMQAAYKKILAKHGAAELLPLWEESGVYNFYLKNVKAYPKGAGTNARSSSSATSGSGPAPMDVAAATAATGDSSSPGESRLAIQR